MTVNLAENRSLLLFSTHLNENNTQDEGNTSIDVTGFPVVLDFMLKYVEVMQRLKKIIELVESDTISKEDLAECLRVIHDGLKQSTNHWLDERFGKD